MILILKYLTSHFLEMFLAALSMVYTFRNLFVLWEYVIMLMTSTKETHFWLINYLNKVIDTINFVKLFSKFYHRHSELIVKYNIGLKTLCNKAYQNLYFMVI